MTVSEAKLEANRRNAMLSCGPRTEAGKSRSKLNALKHGMRTATLVLLEEDPQALEDRRAEWAASLMPRGAAEQEIVDDAVEYSWLRDRAWRAQDARLVANIVNAGVDEVIREADKVLRLGQKLFSEQSGSLANYPDYNREEDEFPKNVPVVSESEIVDGDPDDPQRLVLRLQTTAGGCQWMLDSWTELSPVKVTPAASGDSQSSIAIAFLLIRSTNPIGNPTFTSLFPATRPLIGQGSLDN